MGARGPQPKPTALKVLAGNPGRRDIDTREPVPAEMKTLEAPPEVSKDPGAVAIWNRLVPDLAGCGLARSVDWPLLVRYVLKLARWIEIGDKIRDDAGKGLGSCYELTTETGTKWVEYPYAKEWRTLDRELRLDERQIGISPSARSRITVPGATKTKDDLRREFFRGGAPLVGGDESEVE